MGWRSEGCLHYRSAQAAVKEKANAARRARWLFATAQVTPPRRLDGRVALVVQHLEIFVLVFEDAGGKLALDAQRG